MPNIHSCSYYCDRPECVRRQRDEMRGRLGPEVSEGAVAIAVIKSVLNRARGSLGAAGGVGTPGAASCELELTIGGPLIDWIEEELSIHAALTAALAVRQGE